VAAATTAATALELDTDGTGRWFMRFVLKRKE
jgi:hypothetical protein